MSGAAAAGVTVTVHEEKLPSSGPSRRGTLVSRLLEGTEKFELYDLTGSDRQAMVGLPRKAERRSHAPFAVIDLGSNTARLVIYRSAPVGPPWSLFESKDDPRLMEEVQKDGRMSDTARRRGLETLLRFRRIMEVHHVREVHAVATSAVRDAPNRSAFASEVQRRCGFRLRVLSAAEEARYAYLGVASSLHLSEELLMDLGGGSLQVMAVRGGRLRESLSLPMGALRLHRRFLEHDPPKRKELESLEEYVEKELKPLDAIQAGDGERESVVGVGGTTRSLAHVMQAIRGYPIPRVHGYTIRTRDLERLYEIISESSLMVRRETPGLSSDRADIVVAGLAVVLGVLHRREAETITISGCGIREGLAQETLGRALPTSAKDMSQGSALAYLWASGMDDEHARRVREIALELFDLTERHHRLGEEERLSLEVAALLHDVGTALSYPGHASHSAYFIRTRPLYGLTHRGFLLASLAAGMHEGEDLPGGTAKKYPQVLEEDDTQVARVLGAILALSESVGDLRPRPRFRRLGDRVLVRLPRSVAPNQRLFDRACKWMERSLEVEVEARPT